MIRSLVSEHAGRVSLRAARQADSVAHSALALEVVHRIRSVTGKPLLADGTAVDRGCSSPHELYESDRNSYDTRSNRESRLQRDIRGRIIAQHKFPLPDFCNVNAKRSLCR
jgi:hypothetical protein